VSASQGLLSNKSQKAWVSREEKDKNPDQARVKVRGYLEENLVIIQEEKQLLIHYLKFWELPVPPRCNFGKLARSRRFN